MPVVVMSNFAVAVAVAVDVDVDVDVNVIVLSNPIEKMYDSCSTCNGFFIIQII